MKHRDVDMDRQRTGALPAPKSSAALTGRLLERLEQGLAAFDADGRLVMVNPAFVTMLGLDPARAHPGLAVTELLEGRHGVACARCVAALITAPGETAVVLPCAQCTQAPDGRRLDLRRIDLDDGSFAVRVTDVSGPVARSCTADGFPARTAGTIRETVGGPAAAGRFHADMAERFQLAFITCPDSMTISRFDDGTFVDVNDGFLELTGYSRDEVIGRDSLSLGFWPSAADRERLIQALHSDRPVKNMDVVIATKRGDRRNALISASVFGLGGEPHLLAVVKDLTDRRLAEERLRNSEERFRGLVEGSLLGMVIDRHGKPLFANARFAEMFGYGSPADIVALDSLDVLYADADVDMVRRYRRAREAGLEPPSEYEYRGVCRNGTRIWVRTHVRRITWQDEPAVQSTVVDITLQKENAERLHRRANYDPVTHLPNRNLALERLHRAIIHARRHRHSLALLFIDVDNFKQINDTLGHLAGDRVLTQIAARLRASVREQDTVARLGGDEFAVILPGIGDAENATTVAGKILQSFHRPLLLENQEVFAATSIGCAIWPDDGVDSQALLHSADAAMYRAKDEGRNTLRFFTPELNREAAERQRMRAHLERALANNEFSLAYHPVIDLALGRVAGMEALLRWRSPTLGEVPTMRFIDVAETTGLIVGLGHWVETAVLEHMRLWQAEGMGLIRVAINVSPRQFREPAFGDRLCRALAAAEIPGELLQLDITEKLVVEDYPRVSETMHQLKRSGVRLAIDNFGTGGTTLSHLSRLPVDAIKIDPVFIGGLPADAGNVALVEAMIVMAQRLDLLVVAEGVETEAELQFLRQRGCDMAQGYYFSRPLDLDATVPFLSARQGPPGTSREP